MVLNSEVAQAIEQAMTEYTHLGAEVVEISLPMYTPSSLNILCIGSGRSFRQPVTFLTVVRYGYRCENPVDLEDFIQALAWRRLWRRSLKRRIMIGAYVLSVRILRRILSESATHKTPDC